MQISPSLPQVKAIAAQGQYRALPVHCEILSDFLTPIAVSYTHLTLPTKA